MFCGNRKKEIENTSEFWPYCGAEVEKEVPAGNREYEKVFVEPNENYVDSLGKNYVNSFFTDRGMDRCVVLLSDKRLYLRGNMIDISCGKAKCFNMYKTVDLEDITGTGLVYSSPQIWKLVLAILLPMIGLCSYMAGVVLGAVASILLLVSYMKDRATHFFIEYAGGCIEFDVTTYGLAESQEFEKQIRRAKSKVKENEYALENMEDQAQ